MPDFRNRLATLLVLLLPLAAPAQPTAAPAASAVASAAADGEPRLLKGNDRVYATPPAPPALQGAPVDLRFEDTPVREVVHAILGDLLKLDYATTELEDTFLRLVKAPRAEA